MKQFSSRRSMRRRRGMALLVVMLLISMTLGLSYAAVRSQHTAFQIQRNSDRRLLARQAAATGLTMALKKMHTADWAGVDTTLTGSLGTYEGYQVTYTTGDPSLASGDADYEDIPYRVTLLSTGLAADPDNPKHIARHQIRAVVRLVPRALGGEPNGWEKMTSYTVYQWDDGGGDFIVDVPIRVEGPVRIQGTLDLGAGYQWRDNARLRYLEDLNVMRLGGSSDWRPLSGPVHYPFIEQSSETYSLLSARMGVTVVDTLDTAHDDVRYPGAVTTYQIYPKGKQYQAVTLTSENQSDKILEPHVDTNPLGIFYSSGDLRLYDNVTVKGAIVVVGGNDLHIYGRNVRITPVDMPPLANTDAVVQLPVIVVEGDMGVYENAGATLEGLLTVGDEFEIGGGNQYGINLAVAGRIMAGEVLIRRRQDWNMTEKWWKRRLKDFGGQVGGVGGIPYFPVWLGEYWNLDPHPRLNIKPEAEPVRYHWKNPYDPIYVPHPDDEGLRWDLLEWTENP